eukprot:363664-Chlamydomonas_euryale.AAC.25
MGPRTLWFYFPVTALPAATTASFVMPNSAYSLGAGADAPNESMPTNLPSLDGDARGDGRRQHRVLVFLALLLEQLEAWHRYDAYLEASGRQVDGGARCKLQLRAGANEDDVGLALGAAT